jgi:hypothetical protein
MVLRSSSPFLYPVLTCYPRSPFKSWMNEDHRPPKPNAKRQRVDGPIQMDERECLDARLSLAVLGSTRLEVGSNLNMHRCTAHRVGSLLPSSSECSSVVKDSVPVWVPPTSILGSTSFSRTLPQRMRYQKNKKTTLVTLDSTTPPRLLSMLIVFPTPHHDDPIISLLVRALYHSFKPSAPQHPSTPARACKHVRRLNK